MLVSGAPGAGLLDLGIMTALWKIVVETRLAKQVVESRIH